MHPPRSDHKSTLFVVKMCAMQHHVHEIDSSRGGLRHHFWVLNHLQLWASYTLHLVSGDPQIPMQDDSGWSGVRNRSSSLSGFKNISPETGRVAYLLLHNRFRDTLTISDYGKVGYSMRVAFVRGVFEVFLARGLTIIYSVFLCVVEALHSALPVT
ncbi:hypothetical protein C8R43DRAFT_284218 [Mycena crocata]|nr:hypothetical protein C8R43DRAFT_284218 [Mycena crocata]